MKEFELLPNNKTIHQQLHERGVHLSIGCGEGICGQCKVKYKEGEFQYNRDVVACLYDDEIASCCAIPTANLKVSV